MKISPKLSSDSLLDKYDLLEFRLLQTMSSVSDVSMVFLRIFVITEEIEAC